VIGLNVARNEAMLFDRAAETPSGWRFALRRLLRRSGGFPGIGTILTRSYMVSSLGAQGEAARACDVLVEPALPDVGLTDYGKIRHVASVGYDATRQMLERSADLVATWS
jgi:predicted acylesterase/phospholipase RssA